MRALKTSEFTIHVERERFLDEIASEREQREEANHMLKKHRQEIELERNAKEDAYHKLEELKQLLESEMKTKVEERRLKEEQFRLKEQERRAKEQALFALYETEKHLSHILRSRSWRWTLWPRKAEALLRNIFHLKNNRIQAKDEGIEEEEEDEGGGGPPIPTIPCLNAASDVAVIITCHNYGHYLTDAIESVLRQTYRPRELVIVDDVSTDNTPEVAKKYMGHGVQYVYCNQGHPSSARNEGVRHTSAPFLLFLDADDILVLDYISACLEKMKDPHVAIGWGANESYQFIGH
ncbi:glycosyltransferase [Patescibacteria group bacterium]|nr:glycosyltransferase [Patescibacteria group bacterium]